MSERDENRKQQRENRATVWAALRLFRQTYDGIDAERIRQDWPECFPEDVPPLGSEDLDDLIEELQRKQEQPQLTASADHLIAQDFFGSCLQGE